MSLNWNPSQPAARIFGSPSPNSSNLSSSNCSNLSSSSNSSDFSSSSNSSYLSSYWNWSYLSSCWNCSDCSSSSNSSYLPFSSICSNTVKLQIFVRYQFSYFWLETGLYELIFVLSRASKQNFIEIQWPQDKITFHPVLNFVLFSKVRKYEITTLAKKIETGTQANHRRMHAREITRLRHVRAAVSIFLARVVSTVKKFVTLRYIVFLALM